MIDTDDKYPKFSLDTYLDSLWDAWCLFRSPNALADFVRHGGNIDKEDTRNDIADILEGVHFKNPGGAKPKEQVEFYLGVLHLMTFGQQNEDDLNVLADEDAPNDPTAKDDTPTERLIRAFAAMPEPMGKSEAIEYLADQRCIAPRTGWDQYAAGKKLLGG